MSRSTARFPSSGSRSAALLLTAGAASVALLSACGTGQVSQTAQKVSSVEGVSASVGNIDIDNARTAAPPAPGRFAEGSAVPIYLTISNDGLVDDRLVRVQSDAGASVALVPAPAGATPPPLGCVLSESEFEGVTSTPPPVAAEASPTTTASPSASASPSTSASASASPSGSASATPSGSAPAAAEQSTGTTDIAVTIPHGGAVLLTETCPHLVVRSVTKELWPSESIGIRLTFANAGTVEFQVPVSTPEAPLPREAVPGFDTHGGGHEDTSGAEHGSSPSTSAGSEHGSGHG